MAGAIAANGPSPSKFVRLLRPSVTPSTAQLLQIQLSVAGCALRFEPPPLT